MFPVATLLGARSIGADCVLLWSGLVLLSITASAMRTGMQMVKH